MNILAYFEKEISSSIFCRYETTSLAVQVVISTAFNLSLYNLIRLEQ